MGAAPNTFSGLVGFLAGYATACDELRDTTGQMDMPRDFPFYVTKTLNARHTDRPYGAGLHWTRVILMEVSGDDSTALSLFYELWDKFRGAKETNASSPSKRHPA